MGCLASTPAKKDSEHSDSRCIQVRQSSERAPSEEPEHADAKNVECPGTLDTTPAKLEPMHADAPDVKSADKPGTLSAATAKVEPMHAEAEDLKCPEKLGTLNFAVNPRSFDDSEDCEVLKEAISSGNARICKVTGYTYGDGLYFSGLQLTYEVGGEHQIEGPRYVTNEKWPKPLELAKGETITEVGAQHGEITDQLWMKTSTGRKVEWGGVGGSEEIWKMPEGYDLMGFRGDQGPWRGGRSIMNQLGPIFVKKGTATQKTAQVLKSDLAAWVEMKNKKLGPPGKPPAPTNPDSEHQGDRAVLLALIKACGTPCHGEGPTKVPLEGWGTATRIGLWEGVIVDNVGRVKELYMERANLTGTLPDELGALDGLEELWCPMNDFTGGLTSALTKCKKLRTLNIHGNYKLEGFIPIDLLNKPGLICYVHNTNLISSMVSIEVPAFPFYVAYRRAILDMPRLLPHEEALEAGEIITQMHPEHTFTKWFGGVHRDEIAFMTHRWLHPKGLHPDDELGSKLDHIKEILENNPHIKYVWMDYLCVPQAQRYALKQQAAINSLPHYIKSCQHVYILVGEESEAHYSVYSGRGWCRLERICACVTVKGQNPEGHMYDELDYKVPTKLFLANKTTHSVKELSTTDVLEHSEFDPMEGSFFDETDRVKIAPCVDLLGKACQQDDDNPELQTIGTKLRESAAKYRDDTIFDQPAPSVT
uniref:Uncharacterized protein n=1 Tax=Eutreptiella gymnastica TaxID=73025 RepID=A0A7S4FX25_9EUGL